MSIPDPGLSPEWITPVDRLSETLLDAAVGGTFERALDEARTALEREVDRIDPSELVRYRALFFDLALVSSYRPGLHVDCAIDLLAAATGAGERGWEQLREAGRVPILERLALTESAGLELLELFGYAPDAGMRQFSVSHLVSAGMHLLDRGEDSRQVERLLHGAGATDEAYRLEASRKYRAACEPERQWTARSGEPGIACQRLGIAGGHHQLHGMVASLLGRHGVRIVPIPSSREHVRRERAIVQALQGCDAVMLLVRQISHSTSDQVRKAAARLAIPVIYSNAVSAVAIERQLRERGCDDAVG